MNYDVDKTLQKYHEVRQMLTGIPRDIWPLLLPMNEKELPEFQERIICAAAREAERQEVMDLQRLCGLPIRPNESLGEVKAFIRLRGRKKSRLLDDYRRDRDDK